MDLHSILQRNIDRSIGGRRPSPPSFQRRIINAREPSERVHLSVDETFHKCFPGRRSELSGWHASSLSGSFFQVIHTYQTINLFLANAVRESWEEIRLSPLNLAFLGPLPSHSLILFRRTIFPLVGLVKKTRNYVINSEVERIVEIPLRSFFEERNYGRCRVESDDRLRQEGQTDWEFPCLIFLNDDGSQEILWGVTFYIIMHFLNILFDLKLPDISSSRIVKKYISKTYLTGRNVTEAGS
jgi:8-oxo-dGTP pyrophosphatase MutT (NUDIX family)